MTHFHRLDTRHQKKHVKILAESWDSSLFPRKSEGDNPICNLWLIRAHCSFLQNTFDCRWGDLLPDYTFGWFQARSSDVWTAERLNYVHSQLVWDLGWNGGASSTLLPGPLKNLGSTGGHITIIIHCIACTFILHQSTTNYKDLNHA